MNKIKVLLADDDCKIRAAIEKILMQNFNQIEMIAKTSSVQETIDALCKFKPEIAILDIHLLGGTAIEVVKHTTDLNYKVIFMSAYQEFSLDDIKFASIDFIYKPIDISELLLTFDNVILSLKDDDYQRKMQTFFENTVEEEKQIVFRTPQKILSVAIKDIIYGESNYAVSHFYTTKGEAIEINQPLRHYESMLHAYLFVRCHPHILVNLKHVKRIDYETSILLLSNKERIPFEMRRLQHIEQHVTHWNKNVNSEKNTLYAGKKTE
jgi:two-component system LytT family response regulator